MLSENQHSANISFAPIISPCHSILHKNHTETSNILSLISTSFILSNFHHWFISLIFTKVSMYSVVQNYGIRRYNLDIYVYMLVPQTLPIGITILRMRQDDHHLTHNISKSLHLNSNFTGMCISQSNWQWVTIGSRKAWCWTGDEPLPEPSLIQFIDLYMGHLSSMCNLNN